MTFSVKTQINYSICKNRWQIRDSQDLPQIQRIKNFMRDHKMCFVSYVSDQNVSDDRDMHVLTINSDLISLQNLCEVIKKVASHSRCYLWISVNKFLVYTNHSQSLHCSEPDWDVRLLKVLEDQLPDWKVLTTYYESQDHGNLGNFQYPVTALVLEKL